MPTIKTSEPNTAVDLDDLLSHIRRLGIAVGNPEMQRLQAVFAQAPELSRNELRNLLGALLAKDEWQRTQIGRVFDRLVPFASENTEVPSQKNTASDENTRIKRKLPSTEQETSEDEAAETETKEPFSWRNLTPKTILIASLVALAALITAIALWGFDTTPKQAIVTPPIQKELRKETPIEEPKPAPGEEPLKLIKTIDHWTPYIEARPRDPWSQLLPALLLLLGSGIGFSWLLFKVLEASRQQKANRPKPIKESGRFHVSGVRKPADYHLLNGEQRREMNWGISRYQSEQPLNRLNIPLSVKRSATAGMPQLAFEHSSQEREVWLWQDQSSMNPDLSRLAVEIAHTLQRTNISVQRGYFRGLPSQVKSPQGEVLWSNRHDYPETEPLVVIFADADNFGQLQLSSPDQSDRTLQQLSHWPLLCFVDSSQHAGTLQRLLQPHPLDCVLPQAVADWLANQGQSRSQAADNCVLDSLHQWATACALPNRVIMEDEIRALHNALGFDCAWQFHALTRYAKVSGRGFDFRTNRTQLLNELSPNNAVSEFAKKAVKFWIARNGDLDEALQVTNKNKVTWEQTRKKRQLDRDTALLKLWLTDDAATFQQGVKTLYDLNADKDLQKDISRELSHYSCAGFKPSATHQAGTQQQIILPVAWNDLEAETQRQLLHCGFGGQPDPDVKLCWDNTTRGILAGLAAIMLLSVVASAYLLMPKTANIMTQLDSAEPPTNSLIAQNQGDDYLLATYKSIGRYQTVAVVKDYESMTNDEVVDKEFMVRWQRQAAQAAQFPIDEDRPETSAQHWLLGSVAKPKRPQPVQEKWPDLSIAVIYGDPANMAIRKLAVRLLDTGSADQVLLGHREDLRSYHSKLQKQTSEVKRVQWVYIGGSILNENDHSGRDFVEKIDASIDELLSRLSQSLPPHIDIHMNAKGNVQQRVVSRKVRQSELKKLSSVKLPGKYPNMLLIPGGQFEMGCTVGFDDVTGGCRSNEFPSHTVRVDPFLLSEHEVTVGQFREFVEESAYQTDAEAENRGCVYQDFNQEGNPFLMGPDYNWRNPGFEQTSDHPVTCVSWSDTQAYLKWLNLKTGLEYRLPTEAEWEFAARGGKVTAFFWGFSSVQKSVANYAGDGDGWSRTSVVGSFPANDFLVKDTSGNVWEWVQDCWHDSYEGAPIDGSAWESSCSKGTDIKTRRGGAWDGSIAGVRSAIRSYGAIHDRANMYGFRVAISIDLDEAVE